MAADDAWASAPPAEEPEMLRKIFNELDEDDSGELDRDEVRSLVTQLGMDASEKDVDAAMKAMDIDGDGSVDFDEFCAWWRGRPNSTDSIVGRLRERMQSLEGADPALETQVLYVFELIDADGSGRLDEAEVRAAAKRLGANMSAEDASSMFDEMEKGPSGEVGFHAFRRWYLKALEHGRIPKPEVEGTSGDAALGADDARGAAESGTGKKLWGQAKTRLNALMMFKNAFQESASELEFGEMTPEQWAEFIAQAKWWERMNAGHAPRPRRRAESPVNAASFRLARPLPPGGKATRGIGVGKHAARVLEARKYNNGVSSDWPSVGTQLPGRPCGYISKPSPPPSPPSKPGQRASSAFRSQLLRRRAAATGRARLGAARDGATLARRVGLHSPRSAMLMAPEDVPRVNHIRTQRAHYEQGTAVAEAAWEKAGQRGVAQVLAELISIADNKPSDKPLRRPGGEYKLDNAPGPSDPSSRPGSAGSNHRQINSSALLENSRRRDIGKLGASMLAVDQSDEASITGHTGRWQPLTWGVRLQDFVMVQPHDMDYDTNRVVMSTENGKRLNVTWREKYPYRKLDSPSSLLATTASSVAPLDSQISTNSSRSRSANGSTFRRERALACEEARNTQQLIYQDQRKGFLTSKDSFQSVSEWQAKDELSFG